MFFPPSLILSSSFSPFLSKCLSLFYLRRVQVSYSGVSLQKKLNKNTLSIPFLASTASGTSREIIRVDCDTSKLTHGAINTKEMQYIFNAKYRYLNQPLNDIHRGS